MSTPAPKRDRTRPRGKLSLKQRRYLMGVAVAVAGVVVAYGWATQEELAPILVLAGTLLGVTGMGLAHPTKDYD